MRQSLVIAINVGGQLVLGPDVLGGHVILGLRVGGDLFMGDSLAVL